MVQAAVALGYNAAVGFEATGKDRVAIALDRGPPASSDLADAITKRQRTRAEYDGKALSAHDLTELSTAGGMKGIECLPPAS